MSILTFDLAFEFVVDTVTRQKRIRCVITAPPEDPQPGWEWPEELPKFTGLGSTMEEAILNAVTAYRNART